MDLITQLPNSQGYNAILTLVDHRCSRATLFLPCCTTIGAPGIAKLYFCHIYQWFGLPTKIISDCDPCFTSQFMKALTQHLPINWNLLTAFHPRTDGLSKCLNQWVEQYLRLVAHHHPGDWSNWLPLATIVHNTRKHSLLKVTPAQVLLGYNPQVLPLVTTPSSNDLIENCLDSLKALRELACTAINLQATRLATPDPMFKVGQRVWLDAKNLPLLYVSPKFAPQCQGPFLISHVVTPVSYQLTLPSTWGIHDVFHASLLLLYKETATHGPNFVPPPPDLIVGEERHKVEQILGHQYHGHNR
jgi:hypothetical protein